MTGMDTQALDLSPVGRKASERTHRYEAAVDDCDKELAISEVGLFNLLEVASEEPRSAKAPVSRKAS
jgi:hypothetical protein